MHVSLCGMACSAKAMHSTRPAQSRRRNESLVCKSWFGGTKKAKSGVEASEEEEAKETKTKYSKLVLSLGVDAVGYVHPSLISHACMYLQLHTGHSSIIFLYIFNTASSHVYRNSQI